MTEILTLIMPLFGLIALGYGAARFSKAPAEPLGWLSTFIIYFALPALFFRLLAETPIERLGEWRFIGAAMGVTFVIFLVTLLIGLLESRGRLDEATIQGLSAAYGNIGYMGPAVAILAFGEAAAVPVALIFCFENVMHFAVTPLLMALSGRSGGAESPGAFRVALDVIRRITLHPFILATAAGVGAAALDVQPPAPIERLIANLAQAAAPCALFAMGVTLGLRPLRRAPWALGYIVPMKLLVHPAAMYLALSWAGPFDPVWVFTAMLLASLPTATNVFVLAQQYGVWVERASAAVMITTVFSVATVSALLLAIDAGWLPANPLGVSP